jgi:hypothetical protein
LALSNLPEAYDEPVSLPFLASRIEHPGLTLSRAILYQNFEFASTPRKNCQDLGRHRRTLLAERALAAHFVGKNGITRRRRLHAHTYPLHAQFALPPETYSVTQVNAMMGPAVTQKIYREGSKAILDNTPPPGSGPRVRALYDLNSKKTISWNPDDPKLPCSAGTFGGDWDDPFAMSKEVTADLAKERPLAPRP